MRILATIFAFSLASIIYAQTSSEKVIGKWYTDDKETIVEVYKTGDNYFGKVIWMLDENEEDGTPKVDDKNPDTKLQSRPVMGLVLLKDFTFDSKKSEWSEGSIYDPKNGKTYDCYMWMEGEDLKIKGFVMGMRFIGRKTTWTTAK
ncbi:MAG: DUF2147 domain-containing protein [Bacteroidales bacterium]|nr:DUF2147 domain-containing protein [Bacteroidales bacterium]